MECSLQEVDNVDFQIGNIGGVRWMPTRILGGVFPGQGSPGRVRMPQLEAGTGITYSLEIVSRITVPK